MIDIDFKLAGCWATILLCLLLITACDSSISTTTLTPMASDAPFQTELPDFLLHIYPDPGDYALQDALAASYLVYVTLQMDEII